MAQLLWRHSLVQEPQYQKELQIPLTCGVISCSGCDTASGVLDRGTTGAPEEADAEGILKRTMSSSGMGTFGGCI